MSSKLFLELLNENIKLDEFENWITGHTTKNISSNINRSEFVLYILNYIQDQASRFLNSGNSGQTSCKNNENSHSRRCVSSDSDREMMNTVTYHTPQGSVTESELNKQRVLTQDVSIVQNKCSQIQKVGNLLSPVSDKVLQTTSNRNTSPKLSRYRSLNSNDHCTPAVSRSSQNSQFDPGNRSSCSSKTHSVNRSLTVPTELSSPDGSLISPVSPLYVENFPELRYTNKNQRRDKRQNCMTLGNFLINQKQKVKPQVSRKRIKPTKLILDGQNYEDMKSSRENFGIVSRPFASLLLPYEQPVITVESGKNYDEERHILKEKRSKPIKEQDRTSSIFLQRKKSKIKLINPNPKAVTFQKNVVCLANIYCILLDYNMVPNVTAEVHFVFSLLTIQSDGEMTIPKSGSNDSCTEECEDHRCSNVPSEVYIPKSDSNKKNKSNKNEMSEQHVDKNIKQSVSCINNGSTSDGSSILGSIHNCVLFASVVIQGQARLIQYADRTTLKLLIENERLKLFLPDLIPWLSCAYQKKDIIHNNSSFTETQITVLTGETVKYEIETDNCDNFSTLKSFHNFRKQRDMFYECLNLWQSKHLEPSWSFESALTNKILRLLTLNSDPVNMMHLVRLFCTQLINSAINKDQNDDNLDGTDIFGINKNKLSRLQARLVQPQTKPEPRPVSQFPDDQSFYQQFVDVACVNTLFSTHLIDCLVQRIVHLNKTCFDNDYENGSSDEVRFKFLICLKTSNLLAKFLGLIVFSPYRSIETQPPDIIETEIIVRQEVQPPINVLMYLKDAIKNGRLIFTVPWVIEYLGMMDCVSFYLPYYNDVFQILFSVYKNISPRILQNRQFNIQSYENNITSATRLLRITEQEESGIAAFTLSTISPHSALLLRLRLGWLFDTSFFPEKLFFSLASDFLQTDTVKLVSGSKKDGIDTSDLVDEKVLFECCPYFAHIKLPLVTSSGTKSGTVKHITPVSAQFEKPSESYAATTLELQLEESFLSGQASSFRSTIDFVTERVASACIKHICSVVIAPCKEYIHSQLEVLQAQSNTQVTLTIKKKQLVETAENEVILKIQDAVNEHCGIKLKNALFSLLGPDTLDTDISTIGLQIASRKCHERIIHWLHNHINFKDMFTKLTNESRNVEAFQPSPSRCVEHKNEVISPPQTLINIKEILCDILENGGVTVEQQDVEKLLTDVLEVGRHRSDLVVAAEKLITQLTVDFSVVLIAYRPELLSKEVVSLFISIWQTTEFSVLQVDNPLERILCSRNILLLCQGGTAIATKVWSTLSDFICSLLIHEVLTAEQLESQCVALFRHSWPPAVLKLIADCLKSTLEKVKNETSFTNDPKIMLMLEWVNDTMEEFLE